MSKRIASLLFAAGAAMLAACAGHSSPSAAGDGSVLLPSFDKNLVVTATLPKNSIGEELPSEGLGTIEKPHPIQQAFIDEQAAQCGYCTNGMIMSAKALLTETPHPTDEQVKSGLAGNLCRCGTHTRILSAVLRASKA